MVKIINGEIVSDNDPRARAAAPAPTIPTRSKMGRIQPSSAEGSQSEGQARPMGAQTGGAPARAALAPDANPNNAGNFGGLPNLQVFDVNLQPPQ
jgi:hypothetical protein